MPWLRAATTVMSAETRIMIGRSMTSCIRPKRIVARSAGMLALPRIDRVLQNDQAESRLVTGGKQSNDVTIPHWNS